MENPKPIRRGLILEGGGAKGAYAFGCLKALLDKGIRFDAVAGTSVGAVNAVLFATNQMEKGEEIWDNLRPGRVFTFRTWVVFFLWPVMLMRLLLYLFYKLLSVPKMGLKRFQQYSFIAIKTYIKYIVFIWTLTLLTDWQWPRTVLPNYVWSLLLILLGLIFYLLPTVLEKFDVSWLIPYQLKRELEAVLGSHCKFKMPVYTTIAEEISQIDPDHPCVSYLGSSLGLHTHFIDAAQIKVEPARTYVPRYRRLSTRPAHGELRAQAVLASAALPEGIFPAVRMGGKLYRDGGVVDNLPLYPLVYIDPCDELVIIRVNPTPDDANSYYLKHLAVVDRLKRLEDLKGKAKTLVENDLRQFYGKLMHLSELPINCWPPTRHPFKDPPYLPKIVTIGPKVTLGSFVTGTMRFDRETARRWLKCGYEDASAVINEHWKTL